MQEIAQASRLALLVALAFASNALAVSFGNAETRSFLGEPLDARIPFQLQEGDEVEAGCFALVREPRDGPQMLAEGVLTLERARGGGVLRIRTVAPVVEPAVILRVRTSCPGQNGQVVREYPLLLDPRFEATPSSIASPAIAARISATEGETLEGVAAKVHPGNAEARRRYLSQLRELNPDLAAAGDKAPIEPGTPIALADLRGPGPRMPQRPRPVAVPTEARPTPAPLTATPAPAGPSAATELPAAVATAPPPPRRERVERKIVAPRSTAQSAPRVPAASGSSRRARAPSGFSLKLSSQEMDLTPSGQIDDRARTQLRERLQILDADDQFAAMLQMRNNLRQLETRVADMQLKLDSLLPTRPQAPKGEPPRIEAPTVEPKPAPVEPAKAQTATPPVAAPVQAPKVEEPKVEPAPQQAQPVPEPSRPPVQAPTPGPDPLPSWLWSLVGVFLGFVVLIVIWLRRRSRDAHAPGEWANQDGEDDEEQPDIRTVQHAPPTDTRPEDDDELSQRMDAPAPSRAPREPAVAPPRVSAPAEHIEIAAEVRPEIDSDSKLTTRLKEDTSGLRTRYIQERFPEVQNGTIMLEDPASVVKGARLFYEDGALTRAVELLQFAIEGNPAEVRSWLALFEIFRLERLVGQFAELAMRFRESHGKTEYWRKVQFFGREIDPANELYRDEPLHALETIGPREAKRVTAGLPPQSTTSSVDPIAENWLNAPMDFENEVLANELRMKLMAGSGLTEQDLVPNPMPALRGVEMFNVS